MENDFAIVHNFMKLDIEQDYAKFVFKLNEKADQFCDEADSIHDDIQRLREEVAVTGKQIAIVQHSAKLIEEQVESAISIDKKCKKLAEEAADSARKSASRETLASLASMLEKISAVTGEADAMCKRAGRRMVWTNMWIIISLISGFVGFAGGALLLRYMDQSRYVTVEQLRMMEFGNEYSKLWRQANAKEREQFKKILARPDTSK